MLDQAFKTHWLAALRSGEIKQTRHKLADEKTGGLCCLGVAASCANPFMWVEERYPNGYGGLVASVWWCDDLGISYDMARELADMNDGGKTFAEIADYIERYY